MTQNSIDEHSCQRFINNKNATFETAYQRNGWRGILMAVMVLNGPLIWARRRRMNINEWLISQDTLVNIYDKTIIKYTNCINWVCITQALPSILQVRAKRKNIVPVYVKKLIILINIKFK